MIILFQNNKQSAYISSHFAPCMRVVVGDLVIEIELARLELTQQQLAIVGHLCVDFLLVEALEINTSKIR